jgi:hypothetical protein
MDELSYLVWIAMKSRAAADEGEKGVDGMMAGLRNLGFQNGACVFIVALL